MENVTVSLEKYLELLKLKEELQNGSIASLCTEYRDAVRGYKYEFKYYTKNEIILEFEKKCNFLENKLKEKEDKIYVLSCEREKNNDLIKKLINMNYFEFCKWKKKPTLRNNYEKFKREIRNLCK